MINLENKTTRTRALALLNWVELYLHPTAGQPISRTELYNRFGNTSRSPGSELKKLFLTVSDPYYNMNTGRCIKYCKNTTGIQWVKQQLGIEVFVPELPIKDQQQLESGDFEYDHKSDRLWHRLQFVSKTYRNPILKARGYHWDYDIEAAAPTLLYQLSQRLYQKQWLHLDSKKKARRAHTLTLPHIETYITDRSMVRNQIAESCEISEAQVKFVINAIFQGGVIGSYRENKIFQELNQNYDHIKRLQHNSFLIEIKKEIKQMWDIIREDLPVRYRTDVRGISKRVPLSGKEKSGIYRELELEVGEVIRRYLKRTHNRHLWIHDGWCSKKKVYSDELITEVRTKTGYLIKLTERVIEE